MGSGPGGLTWTPTCQVPGEPGAVMEAPVRPHLSSLTLPGHWEGESCLAESDRLPGVRLEPMAARGCSGEPGTPSPTFQAHGPAT